MKFVKGYCPHCTDKVLMKSTAGRLTCPHCGKEYSTEEAYRLYESIKEEEQSRAEELIREKSVSYVESTYKRKKKEEKDLKDSAANHMIIIYGMFIGICLLFIIGFSVLSFSRNKEEDLNSASIQETQVHVQPTTQAVTEPETEPEKESETVEMTEEQQESMGESNHTNESEPETGPMEEIKEQLDTSLLRMIQAISGIFRMMGTIFLVWAIGQLVLAFKNEDEDCKSRAVMMMVTSILLISIPSILGSMTIV